MLTEILATEVLNVVRQYKWGGASKAEDREFRDRKVLVRK